MVKINSVVFVCLVSVFSGAVLHAELINFEEPDYTMGVGLPGPWVYDENSQISITDTLALEGSQSLSVRGVGYSNSGKCSYPISVPATGTYTVSATIRTTSYTPGNYGDGFVSLGSFQVYNSAGWGEGSVYFEMQKPYGAALQPGHRQIWDRTSYNVIGYFVDGGIYDISYTWDWDADTLTLRIVGSGLDITRVYPTEGRPLTKVVCGGNNRLVQGGTIFDNLFMGQPESGIAGDFDDSGSIDLADFARLAASWTSMAGESDWDDVCNLDNTGDSEDVIDIADLSILLQNWLSGVEGAE